MTPRLNLLKTLAARVRRAVTPRKRGSVLILVVALLVLMALIGTAFMTTARTDLYSATQHGYNTQVDLLVEGVVSLSQDALLKDILIGNVNFRPPNYNDWDSAETDKFLAERYPTPMSAGSPTPMWRRISSSPLADATNENVMF